MNEIRTAALTSTSAETTRCIGRAIGRLLRRGDVVLLNGDLGAGKTTLTQGIAAGLGIDEPVQSPTFTLVAQHEGRDANGAEITLYHLDLYRLRDEVDLESFGFDQYLEPADGVSVIEWPERAGTWLPDRYLLVDIAIHGPDHRRLRVVPTGGFVIEVDTIATERLIER